MSEFTCLLGEPALSDFRRRKLSGRIAAAVGAEAEIDARFVYLSELSNDLGATEEAALQDLLHGTRVADLEAGNLLLIVPRLGTQSPWSSKATDIARRCGLATVARIERGVACWLRGLPEDRLETAAALLHDRMTQSVLRELREAWALFEHNAPRPLATVPVGEQGAALAWRSPKTRSITWSRPSNRWVGTQPTPN